MNPPVSEMKKLVRAEIERMYKNLAQELPEETGLLKEWFNSVGDNIEGKFYEIDSLDTYSILTPPEILSVSWNGNYIPTIQGVGVIDFWKLRLAVHKYDAKWEKLPEILMKRLDVYGTGQIRLPEFKMLAEIVNEDSVTRSVEPEPVEPQPQPEPAVQEPVPQPQPEPAVQEPEPQPLPEPVVQEPEPVEPQPQPVVHEPEPVESEYTPVGFSQHYPSELPEPASELNRTSTFHDLLSELGETESPISTPVTSPSSGIAVSELGKQVERIFNDNSLTEDDKIKRVLEHLEKVIDKTNSYVTIKPFTLGDGPLFIGFHRATESSRESSNSTDNLTSQGIMFQNLKHYGAETELYPVSFRIRTDAFKDKSIFVHQLADFWREAVIAAGRPALIESPIDCGAVAIGVLDWPKEYIKSADNFILAGDKSRQINGPYGLKFPELIANIESYLSDGLIQFKGHISSVEIKSKTYPESFTHSLSEDEFKNWFQNNIVSRIPPFSGIAVRLYRDRGFQERAGWPELISDGHWVVIGRDNKNNCFLFDPQYARIPQGRDKPWRTGIDAVCAYISPSHQNKNYKSMEILVTDNVELVNKFPLEWSNSSGKPQIVESSGFNSDGTPKREIRIKEHADQDQLVGIATGALGKSQSSVFDSIRKTAKKIQKKFERDKRTNKRGKGKKGKKHKKDKKKGGGPLTEYMMNVIQNIDQGNIDKAIEILKNISSLDKKTSGTAFSNNTIVTAGPEYGSGERSRGVIREDNSWILIPEIYKEKVAKILSGDIQELHTWEWPNYGREISVQSTVVPITFRIRSDNFDIREKAISRFHEANTWMRERWRSHFGYQNRTDCPWTSAAIIDIPISEFVRGHEFLLDRKKRYGIDGGNEWEMDLQWSSFRDDLTIIPYGLHDSRNNKSVLQLDRISYMINYSPDISQPTPDTFIGRWQIWPKFLDELYGAIPPYSGIMLSISHSSGAHYCVAARGKYSKSSGSEIDRNTCFLFDAQRANSHGSYVDASDMYAYNKGEGEILRYFNSMNVWRLESPCLRVNEDRELVELLPYEFDKDKNLVKCSGYSEDGTPSREYRARGDIVGEIERMTMGMYTGKLNKRGKKKKKKKKNKKSKESIESKERKERKKATVSKPRRKSNAALKRNPKRSFRKKKSSNKDNRK